MKRVRVRARHRHSWKTRTHEVTVEVCSGEGRNRRRVPSLPCPPALCVLVDAWLHFTSWLSERSMLFLTKYMIAGALDGDGWEGGGVKLQYSRMTLESEISSPTPPPPPLPQTGCGYCVCVFVCVCVYVYLLNCLCMCVCVCKAWHRWCFVGKEYRVECGVWANVCMSLCVCVCVMRGVGGLSSVLRNIGVNVIFGRTHHVRVFATNSVCVCYILSCARVNRLFEGIYLKKVCICNGSWSKPKL